VSGLVIFISTYPIKLTMVINLIIPYSLLQGYCGGPPPCLPGQGWEGKFDNGYPTACCSVVYSIGFSFSCGVCCYSPIIFIRALLRLRPSNSP
jgi:hypothetical protein